jgi:hypothetical protein
VSSAVSPFAPLLASEPELPAVFREQFLGESGLLEGRMDRVWRRGRLLRPVFSALAAARLHFPETGHDVAARLRLSLDDEGRQHWERDFEFPRLRQFDAVLARDRELGLVELLGPGGRVAMPWEVRFVPPGTLVIEGRTAFLRVGRRWLRLPCPLVPTVRVVERAVGASRIHVDLVVTHSRLGAVFGYEGTFELR